ncbi:endopeptidase La [Motiliproteus sediminis]|uniref:endopeptidase La n=1 Tax=Motiliproteus sediminis TaxID=1468178 RepID=UPI001AEF4C81|nr:endopeptidase La [Motiliproteus sediminis]
MTDQSAAIDSDEPELITAADEEHHGGLIVADQSLPTKLYLLPINNRPFFPAQVHPLVVNRGPWEETLARVSDTPRQVLGLCYVGEQGLEHIEPGDFAEIGCAVQVMSLNEGEQHYQFVARGLRRFRIRRWLSRKAPFLVEVDYPEVEEARDSEEIKAYALALIQAIKELLPLNPLYSEELKIYLSRFSPQQPSPLADFGAVLTTARGDELQSVLETLPLLRRMEKVLMLLRKELEMLRLQGEIRQQVEQKMSDHQREFFLREQLKVIQQELGLSKDDKTADVEQFRERLDGKEVPQQAQKKIDEELEKLAVLETGSPEYGVTRNYLDWITALPWGVHGDDQLDLKRARAILDRDHDGLDDVKERILEFLAVGAWRGEVAGSIVLLIGPPGVGKTSIGRSVADALGRPFFRFSLGGMRDEAEIKGHRRTYIGAMPGKLVQALKEVEVENPVIMLDEIDKLGASFQGDPASALLEVLDPEQNHAFLDHYLDVRLDLSRVLFVCTANQLDTIPGPLLDRMEIIRLSGYLTDEKLVIAKHHLWPKALERAGAKGSQIKLSDTALQRLIEGYAREAGVRKLEKLLAKIIRKAVMRLVEGGKLPVRISNRNLEEFVGPAPFRDERPQQGVGVVTGLAWTALGGATLTVEASEVHRYNRGFKLTGKLGDVMKESAEIAYSYIAGRAKEFDADSSLFEQGLVHLHVPEGATPKDGPSAGITMATALLSLARNRPLKRPLGMTGELTLTGQVLAVGGIREKVVAAKRNGLRELILPEPNRRDYDELPETVRAGMTVNFARTFADVEKLVFS